MRAVEVVLKNGHGQMLDSVTVDVGGVHVETGFKEAITENGFLLAFLSARSCGEQVGIRSEKKQACLSFS